VAERIEGSRVQKRTVVIFELDILSGESREGIASM